MHEFSKNLYIQVSQIQLNTSVSIWSWPSLCLFHYVPGSVNHIV